MIESEQQPWSLNNAFLITEKGLENNATEDFCHKNEIKSIFMERAQKEGMPKATEVFRDWSNLSLDEYLETKSTIRPEARLEVCSEKEKKMPQDWTVSDKGIDRIIEMEGGYKLKPYNDQTGKTIINGKWGKGATIGAGHYIKEGEWDKYKNGITQEEAKKLFKEDLKYYEKIVGDHIKVPLTQDQYNALVARAYNCGVGGFTSAASKDMVKYINDGKDLNDPAFEQLYQKLCTSQGKYMVGVENRRIRELDMLRGDYTKHNKKYYEIRRVYEDIHKETVNLEDNILRNVSVALNR